MNSVIISGRLTRDAEVRYTNGDNKTAVARFTLAVDSPYKKAGEDSKADFINCVVFGKKAEAIDNYTKKGTKIMVRGHIHTDSYEKGGKKVYTTDVIVDDFEFCEKKQNNPSESATITETDIPF